ncbi:HNH endonuclease signature motif containing protein [Propionivibrio sp.]|uniref:HNH endonuclease signature motif containing protein n=1 Tax=Propionivibrio sp. TaxID=2212460 RepID=UPI0039E2F3BB
MKLFRVLAISALILAFLPSAEAASARSSRAIAEFKAAQPCPATGKSSRKCPGYQIDHVLPLKCGGPDRPDNMQWLTIEEHKAKTRREARWCRPPKGHFIVKITQGGRSTRYSAIARSAGHALADAFLRLSGTTPFSIVVQSRVARHG